MNWPEEEYPCLGICEMDPETGYCLGCGRPPDYVRREESDGTGGNEPAPDPLPESNHPQQQRPQEKQGNEGGQA